MPECTFCKKHFEENLDYIYCKNCGGKLKVDSSITARLDIIQKKINNEPLNAALYHELGNLFLENNTVNLALEQFHKSLAIETGNLDIYIKISEANIKLDKIQEAESFLEKAFQIDKTNLKIHHELVRLYFKNKNWDKAINACVNYLNKEEDYRILLILARSYQEKGNYKDAIITYEKVLFIKEDSTESLEELSRIYEHGNKYDKFIEVQEKLLKLNPNANNIVNLIRAYLFSSEAEKALEIINKFETQIEPELLRFYKGVALILSGDDKKALTIFSDLDFSLQIVKLTKKEKELILNLLMNSGKLKFNDKSYDDALKFFKYAKEVNPKSELVINNIGLIHYELGLQYMKEKKWEDAIIEFQNSIKKGKTDAENKLAEIHANIGNEYFNKNKLQESYNSYQKAIKFDPQNEEYQEHLIKISSLLSGSRKRKTRNIVITAIAIMLFASLIYVFFHGNIQVTVEPTEAAISIHSIINDTLDVKISPDSSFGNISLNWLKRSEYLLVLESPGYEKYEERISVGNGMTTTREVKLIPEYGSLSIKTIPTGAEVIINDKSFGFTPLKIDSLLAKQQSIILKRKRYLKKTILKTIKKAENVSANIRLEPLQKFGQSEIFKQFRNDFLKNKNLRLSYEIFQKFVNGAEDVQDIIDIAQITGSLYDDIKLLSLTENKTRFGFLKFIDDQSFLYTVIHSFSKIHISLNEWTMYLYNTKNNSSTEIITAKGSISFFDKCNFLFIDNGRIYSVNPIEKNKTELPFRLGHERINEIVYSPSKKMIAYVTPVEGRIQIWLYDFEKDKLRMIAGSRSKNLYIHYRHPVFSHNENILYFLETQYKKDNHVIKYYIDSNKKEIIYTTSNLNALKSIPNQKDLLVCTEYNYKDKGNIKILNSNGKILENISLEYTDDRITKFTLGGKAFAFARTIPSYNSIWEHTVRNSNRSRPLVMLEFGFWKGFDISPSGKNLIFISTHSGEVSIHMSDLSTKHEDKIFIRTKSHLSDLIERENLKSIVYEFIYNGLVKKNYKILKSILHSQSEIIQHTYNKKNWTDFLNALGEFKDKLREKSWLSGMNNMHGGIKENIGYIFANPQHINLKFELKKENNNWKIFKIEKRDYPW